MTTDIGNTRQLFVDDLLIQSIDGARLKMHEPVHRENVLYLDRPWEGEVSWCPVVLKEGDRFRMWYRGRGDGGQGRPAVTCYAESADGIHWERPSLGLIEFEGSRDNNTCIDNRLLNNVSVFRDGREGVPEDERYKAVGRWSMGKPSQIYGMVSPDGIRWTLVQNQALIVAKESDPQFDSPLSAFWDARRGCYCLFVRGWYPDGPQNRIRAIRDTTSEDFLHWKEWQYVQVEGEERWAEHLYTSSAHPYYRAPVYLMFPKRYLPERTFSAEWSHPGQSDVLLLSSRDGETWQRTFHEAFLRPGLDEQNWHERSIFIAPHVVPTAPGEMSMYSIQNYRTPDVHVRRLTLREDGFISAHAPFAGNELEINYATSGAGSVRVEIQAADGTPLPGCALADADEIFGDQIARVVTWQGQAGVGRWAGSPVQLRFVMRDADLYSFRFT